MAGIKYLLLFISLALVTPSLIYKVEKNIPRCFIEELYHRSVLMIKYKIYNKSKGDISGQLPNFSIYIMSEEKNVQVFSKTPKEPKGKFSFTAEKNGGTYRICTVYRGNPGELYMNIRFGSDNMDEPNMNKAVKDKDINVLESKAKEILDLSEPIISEQKRNLEREDKNSKEAIQTTKWYRYLTFVQISICLIIGLVQLNNFRRFLKSQNII